MNVAISAIGKFHMFDLAREVRRLGHNVRVFTGNPRCRVDADLRAITSTHPAIRVLGALRSRIPPTPRNTWWNDVFMRDLGRWLAKSIDAKSTDVLDGLDGPGVEVGRIMKQNGKVWICNCGSTHILSRVRVLTEEHAYWNVPPPAFSAEHVDRCVAEYAESDTVVVPSTYASRSFLERGISSERVYVCPYGVDLSIFHPVPKADSKFRVLFVGCASIRKGIGYLFRAIRPLVERGLCEVWFVGATDPAVLPLMAANRDLFVYKGTQPQHRLLWYYSQASVLVLPSIEEGLALVQAQAMACGIPVISSISTGAEDLFDDGIEGFIVPARDSDALRVRVEHLMANPGLRASMSEAALCRVKSNGGWDRYGERCVSMYEKLVRTKSATFVRSGRYQS